MGAVQEQRKRQTEGDKQGGKEEEKKVDTADELEKKFHLRKKNFKALWLYFVFLLVFCMIIFPQRNEKTYFYTQYLRGMVNINKYKSVNNVASYWSWLQDYGMKGLFG